MQSFRVERRLKDVHQRLQRARRELAVLDEQLRVVVEDAEDARIRSLVAETPLAGKDYSEARRHADVITRARAAMSEKVDDLERRQNELLFRVGGS